MWNPLRAERVFKLKPPSMTALRRWSKMTINEWIDEIRENPTAADYLGYH